LWIVHIHSLIGRLFLLHFIWVRFYENTMGEKGSLFLAEQLPSYTFKESWVPAPRSAWRPLAECFPASAFFHTLHILAGVALAQSTSEAPQSHQLCDSVTGCTGHALRRTNWLSDNKLDILQLEQKQFKPSMTLETFGRYGSYLVFTKQQY